MAPQVENVRKAFVLTDEHGELILRSEKLSEVLRIRNMIKSSTDHPTYVYDETTTQRLLEV